jgi:hypothetical protein
MKKTKDLMWIIIPLTILTGILGKMIGIEGELLALFVSAFNIVFILGITSIGDKLIDFSQLYLQYESRKIGKLVLYLAKNVSYSDMYFKLRWQNELRHFMNEIDKYAYEEKSFWNRSCGDILSYVESNHKNLIDSKVFDVFETVVLNFAINAKRYPEITKFIKKAMRGKVCYDNKDFNNIND